MTLIPFEFWKKYFNIWLHRFRKEANSNDDHETASRHSCTNLKYKVSATAYSSTSCIVSFTRRYDIKFTKKCTFYFFQIFVFLLYIYGINSTMMPLVVLYCGQCMLASYPIPLKLDAFWIFPNKKKWPILMRTVIGWERNLTWMDNTFLIPWKPA